MVQATVVLDTAACAELAILHIQSACCSPLRQKHHQIKIRVANMVLHTSMMEKHCTSVCARRVSHAALPPSYHLVSGMTIAKYLMHSY